MDELNKIDSHLDSRRVHASVDKYIEKISFVPSYVDLENRFEKRKDLLTVLIDCVFRNLQNANAKLCVFNEFFFSIAEKICEFIHKKSSQYPKNITDLRTQEYKKTVKDFSMLKKQFFEICHDYCAKGESVIKKYNLSEAELYFLNEKVVPIVHHDITENYITYYGKDERFVSLMQQYSLQKIYESQSIEYESFESSLSTRDDEFVSYSTTEEQCEINRERKLKVKLEERETLSKKKLARPLFSFFKKRENILYEKFYLKLNPSDKGSFDPEAVIVAKEFFENDFLFFCSYTDDLDFDSYSQIRPVNVIQKTNKQDEEMKKNKVDNEFFSTKILSSYLAAALCFLPKKSAQDLFKVIKEVDCHQLFSVSNIGAKFILTHYFSNQSSYKNYDELKNFFFNSSFYSKFLLPTFESLIHLKPREAVFNFLHTLNVAQKLFQEEDAKTLYSFLLEKGANHHLDSLNFDSIPFSFKKAPLYRKSYTAEEKFSAILKKIEKEKKLTEFLLKKCTNQRYKAVFEKNLCEFDTLTQRLSLENPKFLKIKRRLKKVVRRATYLGVYSTGWEPKNKMPQPKK